MTQRKETRSVRGPADRRSAAHGSATGASLLWGGLRSWRAALALALLATAVFGLTIPPRTALAQEAPEASRQGETAGEGDAEALEGDVGEIDPLPGLEGIDQILEDGSEDLAGVGVSYDPGDRRDPFKSLLVSTDQPAIEGPRPEGIAGLLIDEVILSGIYQTYNGYLAQVQSADRQKSYLLRVGDQLYDGDVIEINPREVIFKQNVEDQTALKPFREVIKSLNP